MKSDIRRLILLGLTVGSVLVLLLVAALLVTMDRTRESSQGVFHTYRVIAAVDELDSAAIRLEAGQRGLLISSDPRFARERAQAIDTLRRGVAELRRLTTGNAQEQEAFRKLAAQVDERVRLATASEVLSRGNLAEGRAALVSPQARQAAAEIAATIERIRANELQLLQARRAQETEFQRRTLTVLGFALFGGAVLLAVLFWGWRRQVQLHQRAETRFRDLVQALPLSLWQMRGRPDDDLRFEFISDNAAALRQIDPEAVRRDRSEVLRNVHPEDRPLLESALRTCAETLSPLDLQYRIVDAAGGQRWIHSGAAVRVDVDGSMSWSGYWADVTEQRELEQALQAATAQANQASQAKSAFLAAMSHEIRTPMNGVLGLLELLSLSELEPQQQATLSLVRESGRSLLRIVDDILDFSKIEANKLSLHPVPASLAEAVHNACRIHSSLGSGKGLLVQAQVDPRISPVLVFDPQRLGQILNNLVSNALKFTERGSVRIEAAWLGRSDEGEQLCISVADTGIGIGAQDLARLFEPFVQASGQSAARYGGTGLGLTISRRLAEMMGGRIEMQSEPGRGTTVSLFCTFRPAEGAHALAGAAPLPRLEPPIRPAPDVQEAERQGRLILVVDDHPTNRMVLRRQVNSLGYAAETAADGRQAYEAWKTGRYALVLADCNMPEMNGYELARAIRRDEQALGLARTPVLACTANALASQASACEEAGMDAWLVKPCGLGELHRQLSRWLPHAPPQPPSLEEPLTLDLGALDAITLGSEDVRAEILADFGRASEEDARLLRQALAAGAMDQVAAAAHRMKGACLTVGALALAEACRRLEEGVGAGAPVPLGPLMEEVERQFTRLAGRLASGVDGLLADKR